MADRSLNRNVVVSDDDPLIRLVLRGALERDGYTVVEAENGAAAIELVRTGTSSAAVLDARMPGLTLTETIAGIRAFRADFPILVLSGQPQAPAETAASHSLFLSKPVDTQVFLDAVRSLIDPTSHHDG